jgi:hypothetical protein
MGPERQEDRIRKQKIEDGGLEFLNAEDAEIAEKSETF